MSTSAKILYIDDETDLLDLARTFFEDENLALEISSDFHEAIALIEKNNYDIVISDAKMPSGSGHDIFAFIKSRGDFKGTLILVTGDMENTEEQSERHYDLVLYKPIRFFELVDQVKSILQNQSSSKTTGQ